MRQVMYNYKKRRRDTAGLIRYRLAGRLPKEARVTWRDLGRSTEFAAGGRTVACVHHVARRGTRADIPSRVGDGAFRSELAKNIGEFCHRWKSARRKKGPAKGEAWYGQQMDDDMAFR